MNVVFLSLCASN